MTSGHRVRYLFAKSTDTQYRTRIAYRILCKVDFIVILLFLIAIGLSACTEEPTPYRPPSSAARATQTALASATPTSSIQAVETPIPTTTPACTDNLTFLETISIPDGTVVHPGDQVDKRWLVQNSGSCNWDDHYGLRATPAVD